MLKPNKKQISKIYIHKLVKKHGRCDLYFTTSNKSISILLFEAVEFPQPHCCREWCWGQMSHFSMQPLASKKSFYIFSSKLFSSNGSGSRGVRRRPNIQMPAKQNSSNRFLSSLDIRWDHGERDSCSWSILDQISTNHF